MIALNHSFLRDIAYAPLPGALQALTLVEHVRRRTREQPHVHHTLSWFDTGRGPLVQWANRNRNDAELGPFVELLLRMVAGPFIPEDRFDGPVEPPLDALDDWLVEVVRGLLAAPHGRSLSGLISPAPAGGADAPMYRSTERTVSNWRDAISFDSELTAIAEGRTIDVLLAAEQQMGDQLIVLPSAKRSAAAWKLDCRASVLHQALLGLEVYAAALEECGLNGERLSREQCAARYHHRTTIPMSEETAVTWRSPARRKRRMFIAGSYGEQYFDMHAKPGNMTRVHVWTPPVDSSVSPTPIYVGHCGRHLD
jgi:hypothetical protein